MKLAERLVARVTNRKVAAAPRLAWDLLPEVERRLVIRFAREQDEDGAALPVTFKVVPLDEWERDFALFAVGACVPEDLEIYLRADMLALPVAGIARILLHEYRHLRQMAQGRQPGPFRACEADAEAGLPPFAPEWLETIAELQARLIHTALA